MTLEETTQLYAMVLRQLLPTGGYDQAPNTNIAADIYAHAKAFAQCDLDAKRLLNVLESIPPELLEEYEQEYGLPLKCSVNSSKTITERLQIIQWMRNTQNVYNRSYLIELLALFEIELVGLVTYTPIQCTSPCTAAVNTEQLRYKVTLKLRTPLAAAFDCIIKNYLPAFLRIDYVEV
jgi:uncharacterized protein YmfQ (DUF2313 family)